jgi:hypothetical protein
MEVYDLERDHIQPALAIAASELGSDYLTYDDFFSVIGSKDRFCKVAVYCNKVSGFSICQIFGPDEIDKVLALPESIEKDSLKKQDRIGLLSSISVSDEIKGKGIGSQLVDSCVKEFISRDVSVLCAMGWKDINGITNIDGILKHIGMIPSIEIRGYWNRFVRSSEGHDCPICGRPCSCSAVLYTRFLCYDNSFK